MSVNARRRERITVSIPGLRPQDPGKVMRPRRWERALIPQDDRASIERPMRYPCARRRRRRRWDASISRVRLYSRDTMVTVPQESLKRWTVSEVRRMIDAGSFDHPERFELVEGLVLQKMGQNEPHVAGLTLTLEAMRAVFAGTAKAVAGVPLHLSDTSEPEPDVMVVTSNLARGIRKEDVLLVVEVADTSLRTDQTVKAALYARHGIPEYVILDVVNRRAEIRRSPKPEAEAWGETLILTEDGEFTPLGASGPLRVADLFGEMD